MNEMKADLVIIGGGPAGLAAAIAAKEAGTEDILILERDARLGGILNQCIHNGFGLHTFREELTGPEYAGRYIEKVQELGIPHRLDTIVVDLAQMREETECGRTEGAGEYCAEQGRKEAEEEGSVPDRGAAGEHRVESGGKGSGEDGGVPDRGAAGERRVESGGKGPEEDGGVKRGKDFRRLLVTAMSKKEGLYTVETRAVILAMGCRERPRGALNIPGYRPAGIYSAGTAQRYVNMEGRMPGREVVILGSGDIGLIMARRMTLEGAKVKLVAELMPYSGGLKRNIVQCLNDYEIPLRLRTTVVDVKGKERVEAVVIAKVDENSRPIPGTEEEIACDTLLLSCGLIPENELSGKLGLAMNPATGGPLVNESLETDVQGVFACGNVLHVHDLVDYVSEEAAQAGRRAAAYLEGTLLKSRSQIPIRAGQGVRYTVPALVDVHRMGDSQQIRFRVDNIYQNKSVELCLNGKAINSRRKRMLAPGEMEQVVLKRGDLDEVSDLREISLQVVG